MTTPRPRLGSVPEAALRPCAPADASTLLGLSSGIGSLRTAALVMRFSAKNLFAARGGLLGSRSAGSVGASWERSK
eukprot:CAMPEP_0195117092 /NCGR_PEP_ID=MMETSP0448-20130528/113602_1 /TAXON_ID=66468 /ORGANISM="Heterocapsa triquestra, Strain CCMP 448" /LENGTH=75 /DNA_ID=CAMNT_0040154297 /DNA_START=17 /DNA_END=241 /DNA_ORIENTATION=+